MRGCLTSKTLCFFSGLYPFSFRAPARYLGGATRSTGRRACAGSWVAAARTSRIAAACLRSASAEGLASVDWACWRSRSSRCSSASTRRSSSMACRRTWAVSLPSRAPGRPPTTRTRSSSRRFSRRPRIPGATSSGKRASATRNRRWCCSMTGVESACGHCRIGHRAILLSGGSEGLFGHSLSSRSSTSSSGPPGTSPAPM